MLRIFERSRAIIGIDQAGVGVNMCEPVSTAGISISIACLWENPKASRSIIEIETSLIAGKKIFVWLLQRKAWKISVYLDTIAPGIVESVGTQPQRSGWFRCLGIIGRSMGDCSSALMRPLKRQNSCVFNL